MNKIEGLKLIEDISFFSFISSLVCSIIWWRDYFFIFWVGSLLFHILCLLSENYRLKCQKQFADTAKTQ